MTTTNPWKKQVAKKKAGSTSSRESSTGSPVHARRKVDQARKRLFAAGWTPAMAGRPVNEDLTALLIALNKAETAMTECIIKRLEHERH